MKTTLTNRETEILILILEEISTIEIANKLNLSKRTVDTHRSNIMRKTESSNLIGLCKYAINNKILVLENIH
ncbi:MAG: response regulator transcription factor [Bacteroidetes bacterium]|nr:response regulator transcription factor [Bacteroidota bacterium]